MNKEKAKEIIETARYLWLQRIRTYEDTQNRGNEFYKRWDAWKVFEDLHKIVDAFFQ